MDYVFVGLTLVAAVLGVRGDTWNESGSNLFRRVRPIGWFAILVALVSAGYLAWQTYQNDQRTRDEELRVSELGDTVETLRKYAEVATLGLDGTTGKALAGLQETTPISTALEGALAKTAQRVAPQCDAASLAKFGHVEESFPDFPFSHYALATCLREKGDDAWRHHARKAVSILQKTTQLPGHNEHHDAALKQLIDMLQQHDGKWWRREPAAADIYRPQGTTSP